MEESEGDGKESDVLDRKIAEGTYIEEEVKNE